MVPVVPFIVTGSPYYVKGRAGTGMRNGHNVGLCREKRFTDSVQGPERHIIFALETLQVQRGDVLRKALLAGC